MTELRTGRLLFRQWREADLAAFAALNADPEVMRYFQAPLTQAQSDEFAGYVCAAIDEAARLGLVIDLQPIWLYLDARTLVTHFGAERMRYFIPLQSLAEAGVMAGGGSDHMQKIGARRGINPYDPFLGMWIAITRQAKWYDGQVHPEQALSPISVPRCASPT